MDDAKHQINSIEQRNPFNSQSQIDRQAAKSSVNNFKSGSIQNNSDVRQEMLRQVSNR